MRLGFGTWPLGGSYGRLSRRQARTAVEEALRAGIRFFDTAPIYGNGFVEELLGEILVDVPDAVVLSKAGYITEARSDQDFSSVGLRRSVEQSVQRLRRPLDICMLHSPPQMALRSPEVWETLALLRREGLVKSLGVSIATIDSFEYAAQWEQCEYIELILNLLDQRLLDRGLDRLAHQRHIRLISRVPLCFGVLSGKFDQVPQFPVDDHRARWPIEQFARWIDGADRFRFLATTDRPLGVAALAFCLAVPQVTWVIPGMKSSDQVRANVAAIEARHQITATEFVRIRELWRQELSDLPPRPR